MFRPAPRRAPLRRALRAALAGAVALGAAACARSPEPEPFLTPLAWEARSPRHPGAVYLLGSIHVGSRQSRRLHPDIVDAWIRAEELVVEVDLDASAPEMPNLWAHRAFLPADQRLSELLAPETWAALVERLGARGEDPGEYERLKPWAVFLRLARLEFDRDGYPAEHGVDRRFLDEAAGKKPVVALESYGLQLDLYDGFSYEVQEMMLRDLLEPEAPFETRALVDAWGRGDEQAFLQLIFPQADRWETYRERFFFERNERMAQQLRVLARDGKTRFVVVGVGHMIGPRGIPALLAAQGFQVERIGRP